MYFILNCLHSQNDSSQTALLCDSIINLISVLLLCSYFLRISTLPPRMLGKGMFSWDSNTKLRRLRKFIKLQDSLASTLRLYKQEAWLPGVETLPWICCNWRERSKGVAFVLGQALADATALNAHMLPWVAPITHWFIKIDVGGIISLVCLQCPL